MSVPAAMVAALSLQVPTQIGATGECRSQPMRAPATRLDEKPRQLQRVAGILVYASSDAYTKSTTSSLIQITSQPAVMRRPAQGMISDARLGARFDAILDDIEQYLTSCGALTAAPLRVGILTRALFNLEEEHLVFVEESIQAYAKVRA